MSIFSRLFPSRSQARLLKALRYCDPTFWQYFAWDLVRREVRTQICQANQRKVLIGPRELDAVNAVLYAVMRLSLAAATSGHHHIYRGTLGTLGASYRAVALAAMRMLVENGFMSPDDAAHEVEVMKADVREAG